MNLPLKIIICLCCIILFSGDIFAEKSAGTTVFNFLKLPVNASHAGFSGISVFNPLNPYCLSFVEGPQISASYASHFQSTSFNSAFFSTPLPVKSSPVVNFVYGGLNYGDMDRYLEDAGGNYIKSGTFGADDAYIGLNYAMKFGEKFLSGIGMKYIWQEIDGSNLSGISFSFSALYLSKYTWFVAAGCENLGADVEGYPLPSNFYVSFSDRAEEGFVYGVEFKNFFDNTMWLKLAGEYNYKKMLFLRAGYSFPVNNTDDSLGELHEKNLSLGFGLEYGFISVDYAWLPYGDLGSTNIFTLEISF